MIVKGLHERAGGGSASLPTSITGTKVSELRYLPFGETRWAWGVMPTDRRYTGQRELAGVGLYDYNARMYWPAAGRFVSADTVVPDPHNPQQFNRYAYVVNNPLKHTDSSGHAIDGYYPSYSDYAGFAFLGVAVAGAGYLAANPYSAQRAADSVAALATDLIESVPLNSGPAPVNHTGGPAVTIEPIATLSFPLGPAAQATLETYPVGAGLAPGDLRTTFPLATGQTLQLAGPMQAKSRHPVGGTYRLMDGTKTMYVGRTVTAYHFYGKCGKLSLWLSNCRK